MTGKPGRGGRAFEYPRPGVLCCVRGARVLK